MATLEQLEQEAAELYQWPVERTAHVRAKTISADGPEVEAAALEIGANEGIDAALDEDDLKHYKLSAIRAFRAAGFYVEGG